MELVIVTGMSGAGKSLVVNALEDSGYYCVDNVPPRLLCKFAELPAQSDGKISRIALVVDVRSLGMFDELSACLEELRAADYRFKVLFMDCDNWKLVNRYKETRRRHPLLSDSVTSMETAIEREREMLDTVKARADYVIDTTHTSPTEIKNRIREQFSTGVGGSMMVSLSSFGFKHGLPTDADLVFDVRCLPNPFYEQDLRERTGLEEPVKRFVLGFPQAKGLATRLLDFIDYLIPLYEQEGKSQLVIAIGCTGGKHRSVVFCQLLADHLRGRGIAAVTTHRDIEARRRA